MSTETLRDVSHNISGFAKTGGGEIKIRLKPDNLGELDVRVRSTGNQVKLKIHANDEGAKRMIEDSVAYLRDSLRARNLELGTVEVTVGQQQSAAGMGVVGLASDQSGAQNQQNAASNWNFGNEQMMAMNSDARGAGSGGNQGASSDGTESEERYGLRSEGVTGRGNGRSLAAARAFGGSGFNGGINDAGRLDVIG